MPALRYQIDRIEHAEGLDRAVGALTRLTERLLPSGPLRDVLHGRFLGHPLHPVLTDVTLGCWTAAGVLDATGRHDEAARTLVGAGIVSALPTAVTGAADWTGLGEFRKEKRVGLVHAVANNVGLACYAASWLARRAGRRRAGVVLGLLGGGAVGVGGLLGGHLAYRQGVGVDHTSFVFEPTGWRRVARLHDVSPGRPYRASAGSVPVVVFRDDERIRVLAATCSHMGGPLDEGEIVRGDCVKCPWHGSEFAFEDGRVLRGPATAPQPAYDVRLAGGWIEARPNPEAAAAGTVSGPSPAQVREAMSGAAPSR